MPNLVVYNCLNDNYDVYFKEYQLDGAKNVLMDNNDFLIELNKIDAWLSSFIKRDDSSLMTVLSYMKQAKAEEKKQTESNKQEEVCPIEEEEEEEEKTTATQQQEEEEEDMEPYQKIPWNETVVTDALHSYEYFTMKEIRSHYMRLMQLFLVYEEVLTLYMEKKNKSETYIPFLNSYQLRYKINK